MAWTYTDLSTDKDKVRLKIGDTDESDKQLFDDEISFQLSESGSVQAAATACALLLAGRYARQMNKAVGPFREDAADRYDHYTDLAARLESQMATNGVTAFAGGISVSDKQTREEDSDRARPAFSRAMGNYPGTEAISQELDD
ncbi:MAG: hypothetical protein WBV94_25215 [Blastocatellia bacterium]